MKQLQPGLKLATLELEHLKSARIGKLTHSKYEAHEI